MALGCFLFGLSSCYVSFVTYSEVFDCRALDAWTHGSTNMCMWPSNGEGVDESAHNRLVVQGLHARAVVAHTELPRDPRRYARADVHVLGRRGGNEGFPMLLGLPHCAVAGDGAVACAAVHGCERPGAVGAPWVPHGLAHVPGPSPVCLALGRPSLHVAAGFDSGGSPAAAGGAPASLVAGAGIGGLCEWRQRGRIADAIREGDLRRRSRTPALGSGVSEADDLSRARLQSWAASPKAEAAATPAVVPSRGSRACGASSKASAIGPRPPALPPSGALLASRNTGSDSRRVRPPPSRQAGPDNAEDF